MMTLDYIMTKYGLSEAEARRVTRAQLAEAEYQYQYELGWQTRTGLARHLIERGWRPWGSHPDDPDNQPIIGG